MHTSEVNPNALRRCMKFVVGVSGHNEYLIMNSLSPHILFCWNEEKDYYLHNKIQLFVNRRFSL